MKISKRLQFIERIYDKCNTFTDIDTDHGYIPFLMLKNKKVHKIISTDISPKPLEACKKNLSNFKKSNISYRIGDGLKVFEFNKGDGICICGIGYDLMKRILVNIDFYKFKYMILSLQTKQNDFLTF